MALSALAPASAGAFGPDGPGLTTSASPGVAVGGSIHDTAALDGGSDPTGTIDFALYGPDDADCSGTPLATSSAAVAGAGSYDSDEVTVTTPGTYRWVASYGGDAANLPATGACDDATQSVVVTKAEPALDASASASVAAGGQAHARATLTGGYSPTGTIELKLYGPDDSGCTSAPLATSTRTLDGSTGYDGSAVTMARAGRYRWVAAYSGDANNAAAVTACDAPAAALAVTRAATAVATTASGATVAGGTIGARATLSGGADPSGAIAFKLYGPDDPTCARPPILTSVRYLDGSAAYDADAFAASRAGAYRWVASYGGDANNLPSAGACGAPAASVTVGKARPRLTPHASGPVTVGGKLQASADLDGGAAPTGTVRFELHGPDDPACSRAPASTSSVAVHGDGGYRSQAVTVTRPGSYRWVVAYGGDADNAAATGGCGVAVAVTDIDRTQTTLDAPRPGEATLELTAHAPGTDWGATGRESAVATVTVDGRYSQDVVLFRGAQPLAYRLALGTLGKGRHRVKVSFDRAKSPAGARGVVVDRMDARLVRAGTDLAARYAPILYGRDEPRAGGRYENNHTDVPLLTYHTALPDPDGTTIEYTVIWSNEDGGTPIDAMMPRWGRTTDIEWVYRVRVDRLGRRVAEGYQDPRHHEQQFDGRHEGTHPLLQTGAANNGVLAVRDATRAPRYRFFMDASDALPHGTAREVEMDRHPWTYALSAAEATREHKFERLPSPMTPAVSNPRNYLFVRLATTKTRESHGWIGTAVDVRLRGSSRWYHSDHGVSDWSVEPEGQVTTSVELPPGTGDADVRAIRAVADPVGHVRAGWRVHVSHVVGAFFLSAGYEPVALTQPRRVGVTLTPGHNTGWIWSRSG